MFSSNSEAEALELLVNIDDMFHRHYMHSDNVDTSVQP